MAIDRCLLCILYNYYYLHYSTTAHGMSITFCIFVATIAADHRALAIHELIGGAGNRAANRSNQTLILYSFIVFHYFLCSKFAV